MVTSQTTMSSVQFVTGTLLVSAQQIIVQQYILLKQLYEKFDKQFMLASFFLFFIGTCTRKIGTCVILQDETFWFSLIHYFYLNLIRNLSKIKRKSIKISKNRESLLPKKILSKQQKGLPSSCSLRLLFAKTVNWPDILTSEESFSVSVPLLLK